MAEAGRRYLSPYCRVVARRGIRRADETLPSSDVVSPVRWRRQIFSATEITEPTERILGALRAITRCAVGGKFAGSRVRSVALVMPI